MLIAFYCLFRLFLLSYTAQKTINNNYYDIPTSNFERNKNMPFNLKEERFKWQTSPHTRECINYENSAIGLKSGPNKKGKTYTIIPSKLPLTKEPIRIKSNYELKNRNTSVVINLKDRNKANFNEIVPGKINNLLKASSPRISSLIKKTPLTMPSTGKKQIPRCDKEKPLFKPGLKQAQDNNCYKSSLSGPAMIRDNDDETLCDNQLSSYSKFMNKKNQSSLQVEFEQSSIKPVGKKFYRSGSVDECLNANKNESLNIKSIINNKRTSSVIDEDKHDKKNSKKINEKVLKFRYKSNFRLI